jgi:hypothetical protein
MAWLLPLACGCALYRAAQPRTARGALAATFGYGLIGGMLLAGAACAFSARADTTHAWRLAAPWLIAFGAACALLAWLRARRMPAEASAPREPVQKWMSIPIAIAAAGLLWRAWLALREILLRPTYPWDAWDAWAVKSKTWYLLGHYVPFVAMHDWLIQHPPDGYTGVAWSYPAALAWMQVWFASAADGWIEPLLNLPWFALWLGMLAAHYGQWRALGLTRVQALLFVYVLASLPLLLVHVALAGYADLWIAALFGMSVLAWLRWLEQRDRGQLVLALLCALALPLLKLEGVIWLLLLVAIGVYGMLPRRRRKVLAIALLAVLVASALIGRLLLPLYGLGWVSIGAHLIDVPILGKLPIAWHAAAFEGLLSSLFVQSNWHLLWWLVPLIVAWRWRALRAREATRLLGLLLLCAFAFLAFLFLFTDAARWAESYTAFNRLLMHIVPATVTLCALLLCAAQRARRGRASAFAVSPARA